ncbi:MAG: formylglycine-generating enzyme family protein [Kofleriaceae bacterium]
MRLAMVVALAACGDGAAAIDAGDAPIDGVIDDGAQPDGTTACLADPGDAGPTGPACMAGIVPGQCIDTAGCTGVRDSTPGLCAGGANIQCCTPKLADGIGCDPNAAPRPNECAFEEEPGDAGCPAGMTRVDTFCIDRFEASLVIDGFAGPISVSPYVSPDAQSNARAVSVRGAIPQGHISGTQAAAACARSGKRLCTNTEWLRACRGTANSTYPYGNTRMAGVCNDARSMHPAAQLYGTGASWIFSHIDSPCLNQLPDGLSPTGAHAGCVSADGIFDMMGNLHEWTSDPAGTFRGGFYVDTMINGNGCLYATTAHDMNHHDYSTGFRCCADAP